tara:strand:+ start:6890 stop:7747 length:858 start_codon:yes stop_codon:yes gene_type:complete
MADIPYIQGFEIKPNKISSDGIVTFTDGTNAITPNQRQCQAYGYTYDATTRTCRAFKYTTEISSTSERVNSNVQGNENIVDTGSNNTYVMGEKNQVGSLSRNNIVVGTNNVMNSKITNSSIFGIGGNGVIDGAMVFGGNALTDRLGTRQTITLMYGVQTTNNSTVDSFPNNAGSLVFFEPEVNRVYYFQSETLAVRVGGSSGSGAVGDFKAWVERGVVVCDNAGNLSIERSRTSPADSGTTSGWSPINAVNASQFRQTVKGASNMTIDWVSTIRFMQLNTGVSIP